MTLPDERYRSLIWADRLLKDLCDPRKTPRVPREVRQRALSVLRHWPDQYYIDRMAELAPEIIESGKPEMDRLYTWVKENKTQ